MLKLTATIALLLATTAAASLPDTAELHKELEREAKLEDGQELELDQDQVEDDEDLVELNDDGMTAEEVQVENTEEA